MEETSAPLVGTVDQKRDVENQKVIQERPPTNSRVLYLYYRFVNPWIRFVLVGVPLVYFYAVLLNTLTFRNAQIGEVLLHWPQYDELTVPRPDGRGVFLVLQDGLYTVIPRAVFQSADYNHWKLYCDFCAFFWNLLVTVICLFRRDPLRWFELAGMHLSLYACMYFTKTITLYPAPVFTEGCMKPEHRTKGMWMFKETATTDFCGDQMFSGHTNNTVLPLIILTRILYDIVGWDFRFRRHQDDYHEPEYATQYMIQETNPVAHPGFTDRNEEFFFHPRYSYTKPRTWSAPVHYLVWSLVTFWRILKWVIIAFFVYGLIRIRQHYTSDILTSILVQFILSSNTRYIQSMVRWVYRPNYWNYKRTGPFALVKLRQPLTAEQANYEERVAHLGRGGLI